MISKKTWSSILFALAISLCLNSLAFGQEISGSIVGTVKDAAGAVVPGATVTITDPSKDNSVVRTVTTNDEGEFTAANVPVSTYDITVEVANFKKAVSTGVKVDVGQRRNVEIALSAGDVSETVTIEADRVSVELNTPTVGTTISGDQARELPINNRNFVQLLTLAPGVSSNLSDQVYVGTTNPDGQANTIQISVNGARSSQNTFTVDGADITDRGSNITIQAYPSVDSIGEFKVLRSLYPAESGRSGGGQVNIVTRSGGDEFHGTFFEFVRNDAFNANTYFNNQNRPLGINEDGKARKAPFRYNNYGFTVGGPVYFLNFGNLSDDEGYFGRMKRTYFFFSNENRDDIRYPSLSSLVPSAALKQGVFTLPVCLSATGTTCNSTLTPGSPLTTINPISQQYINYIWNNVPVPNGNNFSLIYPARNVSKFRQSIVKIDTSVTKDWSMYYRFQRDTIPTEDANSLFSSGASIPFVSNTETDSPGRTHTYNTTYVVSPNFLIEAGYTYGYGAILSKNVGLLALANSPIMPPLPFQVTRDRAPTLSGTGFNALQSFGPYDNFSWKQNLNGAVTWISGNHTMKFGAIYSLYRKNENALAGSNEGIFDTFNTPGATAVVPGTGCVGSMVPGQSTPATTAQCNQQQSWANFLLGTNARFTQAAFDYTADLRQKTFEAFAQDEWKFRPNLTLYFGVRYSFFGSPYDRNGRLTNFVPELFDPSQAPSVTGAGNRVAAAGKNFCNGIIVNSQNYQTGPTNFNCTPIASPYGKFVVDAPKTDFAPRIGLAWDPFKNGDTSVRMGYGIYHDQVLNGTLLQQIGLNPPYQITCQVSGVNISNPVPSGNCNATAAATAPNIRALQADWKTPYMQHWSLDVQRQITKDTIVTVGYYGSKGTNLIGAFELNELEPGYAISRGSMGCATGATYIGGPSPTLGPCQVAGGAFFSAAQTTILDQIRPYRGYRSINIVQPKFNSDYHSMQVFGQHRFSGSSQVNLAYTWSKNLSDNQTDRSTAPQNSYDQKGDYGRAALDRRHILTANWVYDLPFFDRTRGPIGLILGGWQFQGIATYQTGLPLTVTTSNFDAAGLGLIPALIAGSRPLILCDPNANAPTTQQQWFDISCFASNPAAGSPTTNTGVLNVVGTAARGVVEGPSTKRVDFVMSKNFNFTEDMRLQLRAESFNVFNWTSFTTVATNRSLGNFGTVTGTRDPRTFQFGVKFYW